MSANNNNSGLGRWVGGVCRGLKAERTHHGLMILDSAVRDRLPVLIVCKWSICSNERVSVMGESFSNKSAIDEQMDEVVVQNSQGFELRQLLNDWCHLTDCAHVPGSCAAVCRFTVHYSKASCFAGMRSIGRSDLYSCCHPFLCNTFAIASHASRHLRGLQICQLCK